jgi:hypothetical protein
MKGTVEEGLGGVSGLSTMLLAFFKDQRRGQGHAHADWRVNVGRDAPRVISDL